MVNTQEIQKKRTNLVQVRITEREKERLKLLSETSGFQTISAWIRFCCLNSPLVFKIDEIIKLIKENEK